MEAGAATGVGVLLRRNAGAQKRMLRNNFATTDGFGDRRKGDFQIS